MVPSGLPGVPAKVTAQAPPAVEARSQRPAMSIGGGVGAARPLGAAARAVGGSLATGPGRETPPHPASAASAAAKNIAREGRPAVIAVSASPHGRNDELG